MGGEQRGLFTVQRPKELRTRFNLYELGTTVQ